LAIGEIDNAAEFTHKKAADDAGDFEQLI